VTAGGAFLKTYAGASNDNAVSITQANAGGNSANSSALILVSNSGNNPYIACDSKFVVSSAGAVTVTGAITSSVTNGAKTLQSTTDFSVVQDAVQNLAAQNYGFFFVSETTSTGSIAIIAFNAGGPYLVWQQGSDYSVTANTASKYNVYYSSGNQLVVQNKKTATATFNIINLSGAS